MAESNPLDDPLRFERRVPECAAVIFGATGDLARRKLMPSLYRLASRRRLPPGFCVLGTSRDSTSDQQFRSLMHDAVAQFLEDGPLDEQLWQDFARNLYCVSGDFNDRQLYGSIAQKLEELKQRNLLFYLATPPSFYATIVAGLGEANLARPQDQAWRRVVIEKPFGRDLESARCLNQAVHRVFAEPQIYRIDHYLGKETVQNILAFRFANGIFEPVWNRHFVNHVQITAAETIGVEGRGGYYQEAGALRDMIQSHLLQVTATIAMEPPAAFDPETVRDERARLLRAIKIMTPQEVRENAVAGQYRGFRQEKDVKPDSMTETYAAVALQIENWRWAGVPFYLRTGKKLMRHVTDIAIQFNDAPLAMFGTGTAETAHPNLLIVRIQPEEAISLRFLSKQPGSGMRLRPVSMDFNYGASFGERGPTAYETLLVDAMIGDPTLYTREDMVEASWRAVQPILDDWSHRKFDFPNYEPGSWGPKEADEMLARRGHQWRNS
ncbi:MAG TPA: glucose-6-phosphate dehydrogenase [Bryobacteraceae bacterium]|nr:glucose-6-phosphate dehydrogenase [Bryobacteraceae bacterium]